MFDVDAFVIPLIGSGMSYKDYKEKPLCSPIRDLLQSDNIFEVFKGYLIEVAVAEVFRLHGKGEDSMLDDPFEHVAGEMGTEEYLNKSKTPGRLYNSRLFSYVLSTLIRFSRQGIYIDFSYRAEDVAAMMLFGDFESATIMDELRTYYIKLYHDDAEWVMLNGLKYPSFTPENFNDVGNYVDTNEYLESDEVGQQVHIENSKVEEQVFNPIAVLGMLFFYFQMLSHFNKPFDLVYYKESLAFLLKNSGLDYAAPDLIETLKKRASLQLEGTPLEMITVKVEDCFGAVPDFNCLTNVPISELLNFHYDGRRYEEERLSLSVVMTPEEHRQISLAAMEMDNAATHFPPKHARPS